MFIVREQQDRRKEPYRHQLYALWLQTRSKKPFGKLLKKSGLAYPEDARKVQPGDADMAIANAQRIIEMDKRRKRV